MGVFRAPPGPFLGGRQPYEPHLVVPAIPGRSVDNPPALEGGPVYAYVPDIVQTYIRRPQLPASVLDNPPSNPPFAHPGRSVAFRTILASWQPPPPPPNLGSGPSQRRLLPPSLTAVQVDSPPFGHAARFARTLSTIIQAWQPPPPSPSLGRGPLERRTLPPSLSNSPPDNPPFMHRARHMATLARILAAWQPPPPMPRQRMPRITADGPSPPPSSGGSGSWLIHLRRRRRARRR